MKEKIIAAFKTKYLRFGLSNEAIDRIASAKEKTVTEEGQIEGALADAETMMLVANEIQKMRDGEIQKRTDLQKSFDTYKQSHPETKVEEEEQDDEPAWAKKLREQNDTLMARLDAAEKESQRKATLASVLDNAKRAGCADEKGFRLTERLFSLKDGESEEDASARFKSEYDATMKEYFGGGAVPPKGGGGSITDDAQYQKVLKDFAESKGLGEKQKDS